MEKAVLPPGDSTSLEVIFNTRSYTGYVTKRPTITCEGITGFQSVIITTQIMIDPDSTEPLVVTPHLLDLSPIGDTVPDSCPYLIRNVTDQQVQMSVVSTEPDLFSFTVPRSIAGGGEYAGMLYLTAAGKSGSFHKSVTFEGTAATVTRYTIAVSRQITGGASESPGSKSSSDCRNGQ